MCCVQDRMNSNIVNSVSIGVLIIDPDVTEDSFLPSRLLELGCSVRCGFSVDSYLDSGDTTNRSIVMIDVDIFNPNALSDVVKLRTHFGEGPATHIIAMTQFSPGAFDTLLEQAGCNLSVTKAMQLDDALAAAVETIEHLSKSRPSRQ